MNLSIEVKPVWHIACLLIVCMISSSALCVVAVINSEVPDVVLLSVVIFINAFAFLVALYFVKSQTEIAKKALELNVEFMKKETEEVKRNAEDKKYDEADSKRMEHEEKLAKIASCVRVEVSNV